MEPVRDDLLLGSILMFFLQYESIELSQAGMLSLLQLGDLWGFSFFFFFSVPAMLHNAHRDHFMKDYGVLSWKNPSTVLCEIDGHSLI